MKRLVLGLAFTLVGVSGATADEVVLKNGASLTGVVREVGDTVVLEVDIGTMTFRKADVRSITKTSDPIQELEQRILKATDAKGYFEAGLWARDRSLTVRANELFRKCLALDPEHEGARKALGYEKINGHWLEGDELMMAKGYLKYDGRWLPKDTVERMQDNDKQLQIETDRRNTESRIAELQHELAMAKIRLERERLDRDRGDDGWHWGSFGNSWPLFPVSRVIQPSPFVLPWSFPGRR
jgi:hypothetical protein